MAKHPMEDALAKAEAHLEQRRRERRLADAAPDLLAALRIARDHVQVALEAAIEEMDEGGHPAEWRAEAEVAARTLQAHVHQIDAAIAKASPA